MTLSRGDLVWDWIASLPVDHADYLLQDLPRWAREHRYPHPEVDTAFAHFWSKRQEFRSVVRYRVKEAARHFGGSGKDFDSICAGLNWLFVQNLYLSCSDIGPGLYIEHGFCTVVYARKIGMNFRVNQNVTVGTNKGGSPVIGDNVSVFAHAVVIGNIAIGDNVRIGAGAVVITDVPSDCTVVPQKARIIQR
jgi:serine O-acetyltransferase